MAAGGYHHHLGLNIWAGHSAPTPPPDAVGLVSFSLVLPDSASRDQAVARLDAGGVAHSETPHGPLIHAPDGQRVILAVHNGA